MDELARVELKKMQGEYDTTVDEVKDGQFKSRRQLVYIEDFNVNIGKADGTPWISFTIVGAEKDNEKCIGDVLFGLMKNDTKRRRQSMAGLSSFMKALGLEPKIDLETMDKTVAPVLNKVFEAKIDIRKGKKGGEFLNVTPLKFKDGAKIAEESKGDLPF